MMIWLINDQSKRTQHIFKKDYIRENFHVHPWGICGIHAFDSVQQLSHAKNYVEILHDLTVVM